MTDPKRAAEFAALLNRTELDAALERTPEPCDRAEILMQRAANSGWLTERGLRDMKAHIRIGLDTEVQAGGPYVAPLDGSTRAARIPAQSVRLSDDAALAREIADARASLLGAFGQLSGIAETLDRAIDRLTSRPEPSKEE